MDQQDFFATSSDTNKKVELCITQNQNNSADEGQIDLMNIVGNMKKRRSIFLRLTVVLLIIGIIAPLFLSQFDKTRISSVAVLTFTEGGGNTNPSGDPLDVSEIKSSYIIKSALNSISLSEKLSVADVSDNVSIERLISEETRQKLVQYYEMKDETESKNLTELIKQIETEYSNQYVVTLKNGFGEKSVFLADSELNQLLKSIVDTYSEYYFVSYVNYSMPQNILEAIDLDSLDYIFCLDELENASYTIKSFCVKFQNMNPSYKSNTDGLSFADFAASVDTIAETDLNGLYSYIYQNGLSKNTSKLLDQYSYTLTQYQLQLAEIDSNISTLTNVIEAYKRDNILISSSTDASNKQATVNTDYYNGLIIQHAELSVKKHALEESIKQITYRIEQFTNKTADTTKVASFDSTVRNAYEDLKAFYAMVCEHVEEFFNSGSVRNGYITAVYTVTDGTGETDGVTVINGTPAEAGSVVKNVAIGVAAAVFVAFAAWVCDGFIIEFKNMNEKKAVTKKKEA